MNLEILSVILNPRKSRNFYHTRQEPQGPLKGRSELVSVASEAENNRPDQKRSLMLAHQAGSQVEDPIRTRGILKILKAASFLMEGAGLMNFWDCDRKRTESKNHRNYLVPRYGPLRSRAVA